MNLQIKLSKNGIVKLSPDSANCGHEEHKANVSRTSIPIRNHQPRRLVEPHIVFADTSTLWFEDKEHRVDSKFDEFWREYRQSFGLELHIPEVVYGELLFQHVALAVSELQKANAALAPSVALRRNGTVTV